MLQCCFRELGIVIDRVGGHLPGWMNGTGALDG
jgi:hypothetical protein